MVNLSDPIYSDAEKAREHLEGLLWPNGPICPHCGNCDPDRIVKMKVAAHRAGLYRCHECTKQFSVMVGTVMERSHIPLNKWLFCTHLMTASKKGMATHQLHRMLGLTYKTAWFMAHRVREAMKPDLKAGPLGGPNKVVEVDEAYFGGKAANRAYKPPPKKQAVVALVEREGRQGVNTRSRVVHCRMAGELTAHLRIECCCRRSSDVTRGSRASR